MIARGIWRSGDFRFFPSEICPLTINKKGLSFGVYALGFFRIFM
jgi:hypothetical protein